MKTTIYMGMSVDGFVARPDDGLDFLPPPPEGEEAGDAGFSSFLATVDVLVMGRRTFEVVCRFGPEKWPYGDTPVRVLTRTLSALPAGTPSSVRLGAGEPAEVLRELAASGAKHVYVDGAGTARAFLAAGCVTDLVVTTVPVLIGRGISLWGPLPHDIALSLVASRPAGRGMMQSHYRVSPASVEPQADAMTHARLVRHTRAEYAALERSSNVKHEFFDGVIYAMAGGSPEHASIAVNVATLLNLAVRDKPCRVYSSDLRIRVTDTGLETYPDVSVVCGGAERHPAGDLAVTNPVVLVEVMSPSTEAHDRGEKLRHYRTIASLVEVVLVDHRQQLLELHRRGDDGVWTRHEAGPGSSLRLSSLACDLPVDEVYRDGFAQAGGR